MIIFFGGENKLFIENEVKNIINDALKNGAKVISYSDIQSTENLEKILNECSNLSLFDNQKLIIIRGLKQLAKLDEKFFKSVSQNQALTIIIIEENATERKLTAFKNIKKYGKAKIFNKLNYKNTFNYIKQSCDCTYNAAAKLIEIFDTDLLSIQNSIEILKIYSKEKGKKSFDLEDIEALNIYSLTANVWDLMDAISLKDKKKPLSILNKLLKDKNDYISILNLIARHLIMLIKVKSLREENFTVDEISKKAKIHPFISKKIIIQADSFSLPKLKAMLKKLVSLDAKVKTGKINERLALNLLVASF